MEIVQVGAVTLYPYGMAVALGCAAALLLAGYTFRKGSIPAGTLSRAALWSIALGLLGARLGYCLCVLESLADEGLGFFFRFTGGGYLLYGTVAGAAAGLLITAKLSRVPFLRLADAAAAPGALLIAVARMAEGLCGTGYGWSVNDWFAEDTGMSLFTLEDPSAFCRFPFAVSDFYGGWNWAVFVLMAMLMLVLCAVLLKTECRTGGRTLLFLLLYASAQVWGESLRQDDVLRFGFVRFNQVIGAVIVLVLLVLCAVRCRDRKLTVHGAVRLTAGALLVVAMEFALEKKISLIEWMPMDVCYVLSLLGCVLLVLSVLPMWNKLYAGKDND